MGGFSLIFQLHHIKRISGSLNPADPLTHHPDFLPAGEEESLQRTMLIAVGEDLQVVDLSLDDTDPHLDSQEVHAVNECSSDHTNEESANPVVLNYSFCPPLSGLQEMLLTACDTDSPVSEDDDNTELKF